MQNLGKVIHWLLKGYSSMFWGFFSLYQNSRSRICIEEIFFWKSFTYLFLAMLVNGTLFVHLLVHECYSLALTYLILHYFSRLCALCHLNSHFSFIVFYFAILKFFASSKFFLRNFSEIIPLKHLYIRRRHIVLIQKK